jgi:hypothetical protein
MGYRRHKSWRTFDVDCAF